MNLSSRKRLLGDTVSEGTLFNETLIIISEGEQRFLLYRIFLNCMQKYGNIEPDQLPNGQEDPSYEQDCSTDNLLEMEGSHNIIVTQIYTRSNKQLTSVVFLSLT